MEREKTLEHYFGYGNVYPRNYTAWEIETEYLIPPNMDHIAQLPDNTVADKDGSLKVNGYEFIMRKPKPMAASVRWIGEIKEWINKYYKDAFIRDSHRAAIHMHYNVQHLTEEQLTKRLLIYWLCEPGLFENVYTNARAESRFCRRFEDQPGVAASLFYNKNRNKYDGIRRLCSKYYALNIGAVERFGTVEFRGLKTNDIDLGKATTLAKFAKCVFNHNKLKIDDLTFEQILTKMLANDLDELLDDFLFKKYKSYADVVRNDPVRMDDLVANTIVFAAL